MSTLRNPLEGLGCGYHVLSLHIGCLHLSHGSVKEDYDLAKEYLTFSLLCLRRPSYKGLYLPNQGILS